MHVGDIVGELGAKAVKGETSFFLDAANVVFDTVDAPLQEESRSIHLRI